MLEYYHDEFGATVAERVFGELLEEEDSRAPHVSTTDRPRPSKPRYSRS